uniref:Uncharacterized protein LOC117364859 n=1 Tax=Geotrypetes seraphini TaxID=260995 RepID=A0A6P8S0H9_GEOSA|nr:uncharacterized protein LOC117364859 [Geotrypetes seraphini]
MSCSTTGPGLVINSDENLLTQKDFVQALYQFMKNRHTPIERIPNLGFKQIDLFLLYKTVIGFGGYNRVTLKQQWRQVYNQIGGNPRSTSAATCTRKHYERMILPYERHLKGEKDHPELLSMTVKRCGRGLYKDQVSEQHVQEEKKPRLVNNSKKKFQNRPFVFPHEPVTGLVPNRDQRQWQQEHQEVLAFSSVTPLPLSPIPLTVHANQSSSPQHARYILVNEQTRINTGFSMPQESEQQYEYLGQLRKQKSIGEEEALPLNLSSKPETSELLCNPDLKFNSSSSSKCTIPKFLNQVSPLYPTHLVKKVENQIISPGNCVQESLLLPVIGNHTQLNAQFLMKLKGKDISEARRQISINLNSSHCSKKIPYVERSRRYSIPGDNSCYKFSRVISQTRNPLELASSTSISQDLCTFLQHSPHCRVPQLLYRVVNRKREHSHKKNKTTEGRLSKEPSSDLSLHPYPEQKRDKCFKVKKSKPVTRSSS